ncbi:MAG: hypothetical protein DRO99_00085 [Candidatus Aenigmatarchaeota archaeon]|nr:MAG: hypothetical protein DRO99_00085 [Candidatus Aenigmarchaeota archaeon]
MEGSTYDLAIIGSGPAGLTAGIYAGRYLLNTLIISRESGGTIMEAHRVCNFPTYNEIRGFDLSRKMIEQVGELGIHIKNETVEKLKENDGFFEIKTNVGTHRSKKLIIATGREKRKLGVAGEKELLGKGVSYCATCDAAFFKDKNVAVIGGSNSALTAALLVAEYAKKVYIIYRRERFFRADPAWVRITDKNEKIEYMFNSEVGSIKGGNSVEKLVLKDGLEVEVGGVFIEIGYEPNREIPKQLDLKTDKGYIVVDNMQKTNVGGVFAAGDVTNNPLKQVITACGQGAVAAMSAYEELNKENDGLKDNEKGIQGLAIQ